MKADWYRSLLSETAERTPDGGGPGASGVNDDDPSCSHIGAASDDAASRFRRTVECAPVGIAHVAPEGRWLWVNDRLCEVVGYTREALLSGFFQDITHPDDLDEDLAYVTQMLRGERDTYAMDKRYIHKDGSLVWVHLTVSLIRDDGGKPLYFIAVVEDIGGRKRLEADLHRLTEEQAQILSVVGHELGTPLTTLKARMQLLRRHFERQGDGTLPPGVAMHLTAMERAQEQVERQAQDLRTVAHVAHGDLPITRDRCDLADLCRQTVEEQRLLSGREIQLHLATVSAEILADCDRISQVLTNLVTNALKYSSAEHPVAVSLDRVGAEKATVAIRDFGQGIPAEALPRLFDRFYRVPGVRVQSGNAASLGLGLYIVRAIVERHGGGITVESRPGEGTTFRVTLPLLHTDADDDGNDEDVGRKTVA